MESDYERIARVIRYLDKAGQEQPPLEQIARVAGCSPAHFHRMFHRWAGITPKDFIKSLTFSRARDLLRSGQTVLDTTYESGLSSPGRLHDLCITLSAATPGDIKNRGRDLKIEYSFVETPFGEALIANCQHGICISYLLSPPVRHLFESCKLLGLSLISI
ncbi:AraC family transcriptional regulator [Oscillatoria laete-virens NRMC-F 0139]|nr:AraC family transcriptional regulator [Oscillatoria laete-virens]MDL5055208.1 AraC family transcriptional regulator [Oscillatoria laete-virens NRMC-F 0139]